MVAPACSPNYAWTKKLLEKIDFGCFQLYCAIISKSLQQGWNLGCRCRNLSWNLAWNPRSESPSNIFSDYFHKITEVYIMWTCNVRPHATSCYDVYLDATFCYDIYSKSQWDPVKSQWDPMKSQWNLKISINLEIPEKSWDHNEILRSWMPFLLCCWPLI